MVDLLLTIGEFVTVDFLSEVREAESNLACNDNLIVGVFSDELTELKLGRKPLRNCRDRAELLTYFRGINEVMPIEDEQKIKIGESNFFKFDENISQQEVIYDITYTAGTFDLLHLGHIEHLLLSHAQSKKLIVGVNGDELVRKYKGITPNIPEQERLEIIKSLKCVDDAFIVNSREKGIANEIVQYKYNQPIDMIFIGSDWKGKDLANEANIPMQFTHRDKEIMKTRSSSYFRKEIQKFDCQ